MNNKSITVSVKHGINFHPFGIEPRCALHKFITATQNGLSMRITKITLFKTKTNSSTNLPFDVTQYNKFLIEDFGIEPDDTIEVEGTNNTSVVPLPNEITIIVANLTKNLMMETRIDTKRCLTSSIYRLVSGNREFGTGENYKLFHKGVELLNADENIMKYGLVNGSHILIE